MNDRVLKMLEECSYTSIHLNMSDTFMWGSAYPVDCQFEDLETVTDLYERYGRGGVVAWCGYMEGMEIMPEFYKEPYATENKELVANYLKAKAEIELNPEKYYHFWKSVQIMRQGGLDDSSR